MTTSVQGISQTAAPEPPRKRRWPVRAGAGAAGVVLLTAGISIGIAAGNNHGALSTANSKLAAERATASALNGQVASLQSRLSAAQQQAKQADSRAQAKASTDWAARNTALNQRSAALDQRSQSLDQREQAVKAAEGRLQSSQISSSGVYVVGQDIKPGVYHTNGDGGSANTGGLSNACYFATLNSTDTSDIIDNNNFDGAETVNLSGAYALEINGPCGWVRVG